jgi:hypothetical protein
MTHTTSYKKFGNKTTTYNGERFDSKFEAGVAHTLELRKRAGEIKDYERQFKIECVPYNSYGKPVLECKVSHKVDFRVHELDGSFTLLEAKGLETADYKMRKKWLEKFWLPANPDHEYQVVYQGKKGWRALNEV